MSKFKVGDKVKCITEREFFSAILGRNYEVTKLEFDGFHTIETGDGWFNDDMFELAWQPEPGEMIEVYVSWFSNWQLRQFLCMDDDLFVCRKDKEPTHFYGWEKGRPIKKTHTITLEDGTKVELSEESYNNLKDGIN